jgi:hypothetical protein
MTERIDPGLLQARWVLGDINSEDLPTLAALALEQGLDGTALRQLAGLVKPTLADLEDLPGKAFANMGLRPIDKCQAVDVLRERGVLPGSEAMSVLLQNCGGFLPRWRDHRAESGGCALPYADMADFAHYVAEDLYDKGKREELNSVFEVLESLLEGADPETENLIAVGFFERLLNLAYKRPGAGKAFEEFMRPRSLGMWLTFVRFAQKGTV